MFKINNVQIPLKTMIKLQKQKHHLRGLGYSNFATTANKNGDVALLTYNDPQHDELHMANVIKHDGKESISFYNTSEKKYRSPYVKEIETWDRVKDNLVFNRLTKIVYNGFSKVPESISTMYLDKDGGDGVQIENKFPFKEYSKRFQKPQD